MAMARRLRELKGAGKPGTPKKSVNIPEPVTVRPSLRSLMPSAGMIYRSDERLMHDIRRDKRVAEALEAAIHKKLYHSVSHAFTNMFRVAGPLVSSAHSQSLDLWDILPRVQREIKWARNLPQAIFFELFTCLIEARNEWQKSLKPLEHFPPENASLFREIDTFRRNVDDYPKDASSRSGERVSWILVDAIFFNELARGLDIDEDEGEDVETQEVLGLERG